MIKLGVCIRREHVSYIPVTVDLDVAVAPSLQLRCAAANASGLEAAR